MSKKKNITIKDHSNHNTSVSVPSNFEYLSNEEKDQNVVDALKKIFYNLYNENNDTEEETIDVSTSKPEIQREEDIAYDFKATYESKTLPIRDKRIWLTLLLHNFMNNGKTLAGFNKVEEWIFDKLNKELGGMNPMYGVPAPVVMYETGKRYINAERRLWCALTPFYDFISMLAQEQGALSIYDYYGTSKNKYKKYDRLRLQQSALYFIDIRNDKDFYEENFCIEKVFLEKLLEPTQTIDDIWSAFSNDWFRLITSPATYGAIKNACVDLGKDVKIKDIVENDVAIRIFVTFITVTTNMKYGTIQTSGIYNRKQQFKVAKKNSQTRVNSIFHLRQLKKDFANIKWNKNN
ncbi:hypothetical protein OAB94_02090 [Flavobacteriaceae bacterium]|nr:hypothetical protein [Flavobacteriaceae bacterium]